jgi:hypothetical protein
MEPQVTKEQTNRILQELLELNHITDPNELDIAIRTTLAGLTKLERATLEIKLGQKTSEIEAGIKPSPVLKIIISLVISIVCYTLLLFSHPSIFWRILLYFFGFMSGMMFWIYIYYFLKSKQGHNGD